MLTVCKSCTKKKWSFPWRASNRQPFLSRGKHNLLHCQQVTIKLSCPYAPPEFIVLLRNHSLLRLIDTKTMKKIRHLSACQPHVWVLTTLLSNALNRRSLWGCEVSWKSLAVFADIASWQSLPPWDVSTSLISLAMLHKRIHNSWDYSLCYQFYLLIRNICSRWIDLKWSC